MWGKKKGKAKAAPGPNAPMSSHSPAEPIKQELLSKSRKVAAGKSRKTAPTIKDEEVNTTSSAGEEEIDRDEDEDEMDSVPKRHFHERTTSIYLEDGKLVPRVYTVPLLRLRLFICLFSVPYSALTKAFSQIEATTKRLEKNSILTAFLLLVIQRSAPQDTKSLLQTVYLCINRLSPDYIGIELGIGESLLIKAIGESTGRSVGVVKADLKKEGDLGLVAMNSKNSQKTLFKPKPLTVPFVFTNLKEIATTSGHSSQAKKVSVVTKLLAACQDFEAKIGNAEKSVLLAIAHAAVLAENEKRIELPSYDEVIPALLERGIDGLREHCKLRPGVPLKPMLAKPTKAIGEVLDRFENKKFTCEYKYDGERAQVHKLQDGTVAVFSRNSEDMSKKYPDLVDQLPKCIKDSTKTFVLDAEAVAIDRTTKRKRKDVKVEDIQVRVCLFAFDLLYLNGEVCHYSLLREHFQPVSGEFEFAKSNDGETTDEIQTFLEDSMLDTDASFYEPSRRSINWLKVSDYLAGVGDSLDLVVVGGYYGKGKRTNVYGAFLLACYDADSEEYQTICKIGTGFSDEMLQSHYDLLKPLEVPKPRGDIKVGSAKPDIWFEPKIVWEVLTADLSLSPVYTAAQGLVSNAGISLRFPRFIRVRDDKSVDDATNSEQNVSLLKKYSRAAGDRSQVKKVEDMVPRLGVNCEGEMKESLGDRDKSAD
ncbi:DNA ligase [Salix suchowensis]|nr:DNA ligase [Salix suchowensis]